MIRQLIIILILSVVVSSCQKQFDHSKTIIAEFPNEVGNHWRYILPMGPGLADTVDMDIVGTRTLPDGQVSKIWVIKYLIYFPSSDTSFVVFENSVAKIYKQDGYNPLQYVEKIRYLFPLVVGNNWTIPQNYKDSTRVLGNYPVTVPAGTFVNTFELKRTQDYLLNTFAKSKIWFTPYVGMIRLDHFGIESTAAVWRNGIWELYQYSLN